MTLQEIIQSLDNLSVQDQTSLFDTLRLRLAQTIREKQTKEITPDGEAFWEGVLRFRETIEKDGIEFTDEDFADLRDRSLGREIEL